MSNTRKLPNAAAAEATGEDMAVHFGGHTYHIPPSSKWELDAVEAAEEGRIVTSTRLILGAEQWSEFRKRHSTLGDLEGFMLAVSELSGGNL